MIEQGAGLAVTLWRRSGFFHREAIVTIESTRHAKAEEVRAIARVADTQQTIVVHSEVLEHGHVVQVVAELGRHRG